MKEKEEPGNIIKKNRRQRKNVSQTKQSEQALYISFLKIIHPRCLKHLVYYSQYKLSK